MTRTSRRLYRKGMIVPWCWRLAVAVGWLAVWLDVQGAEPAHGETPATRPSFQEGDLQPPWLDEELADNGEPGEEDEPVLSIRLPEALLGQAQELASTNVFVHPHQNYKDAQALEFQHLLEMAIDLRKKKLYGLASNHLQTLLMSRAPNQFKRAALLELAIGAEEQGEYGRAIQVYGQFNDYFKEDPIGPEVFLRQGLLYRRMGAPTLALSKFYAVLSSAINLRSGNLEYYQKLVLQAQTEIGDTHFNQGDLREAAEAFTRLLQQKPDHLNEAEIRFKLIRCLAGLDNPTKTILIAREFLEKHAGTAAEPEVRFLLSQTLMGLGQKAEALQQVLELLQSQQSLSERNPTNWVYWQQRTGNQIANQLYEEGDYLSALRLYTSLAEINPSPAWQLPVYYQIGLIHEKLEHAPKAVAYYEKIREEKDKLPAPIPRHLQTVIEMAQWRASFIHWQLDMRHHRLGQTNLAAPHPVEP